MQNLNFEILKQEAFEDYAELANLGGCSDYGESHGLDGFQVDFHIKISNGSEEKEFNLCFQSEERNCGLRNYAGWEMWVYEGAGDIKELEQFLDYKEQRIVEALARAAEKLAKKKLEELLEEKKLEG